MDHLEAGVGIDTNRRIAHLENQKAGYGPLNVPFYIVEIPFYIVEDLKDVRRPA